MINKVLVLTIGLLLSISKPSISQIIDIGLLAGTTYYIGDINPRKHFQAPQIAYGVIIRYNYNSRWSFRIHGMQGKITADDNVVQFKPSRGLNFTSKITEFSFITELHFLHYYTGSQRFWFSPYIFGGVGALLFNPQTDGLNLQILGTEGQNIGFEGRSPYKLNSLSFPFGLGVKYSATDNICIGAEWGMRKTLTDYLDDVSQTYYLDSPSISDPTPSEVLSDPSGTHRAGMERGDSSADDWYSFAGISLTVKFNFSKKYECNTKNREIYISD